MPDAPMWFWLYRFLFLPLIVLASPYYLGRMRRRGGYRAHFGQRFGATPPLPPKGIRPRLWVQAVSVGEMLAIEPLVRAWAASGYEIYLTSTTSTGYALAASRLADVTVGLGYFPLDWWAFSARAWRAVQPDLVVLTEGERWPEHLRRAQRHAVPSVAVNARLSDRSFRRMKSLGRASQALFGNISLVLAASPGDAARFRELGFASKQVEVTGNIKLDFPVPDLDSVHQAELRAALGFAADAPILLGSSTWPGEEVALLTVFAELRALDPTACLLLVPRHAERRAEIVAALEATSWRWHLRSVGQPSGACDVAVADTTGELRQLTTLARLAFVGKSLPPHGEGQTPVEAAALGCPLVLGPGMSNFRLIAKELVTMGAARQIAGPSELGATILHLWPAAAERSQMAAAGRAWHTANRGAVARTQMAVARLLVE